jgi:hypothetical protein
MSAAGPLERRLLWLALGCKLLFWATIGATLIVGIREAAAGRTSSPPMPLIHMIAILAAVQLAAWAVWALVRRARLKGGGS